MFNDYGHVDDLHHQDLQCIRDLVVVYDEDGNPHTRPDAVHPKQISGPINAAVLYKSIKSLLSKFRPIFANFNSSGNHDHSKFGKYCDNVLVSYLYATVKGDLACTS